MKFLELLLICTLLALTHHISFLAAQTDCTRKSTLTSNVLYKANLDSLLSSLATNVDATGFYNASVGLSPNTVYGSVMCRADTLPDQCQICAQNASLEIQQDCPLGKKAIHWNEFCTVRFSNESMFRVVEVNPYWFWWSPTNATNPETYMANARSLLESLGLMAPFDVSNRKVAWGNTSTADFQTIFGLVQCSPDMSSEDCSTCLVSAIGNIPERCSGRIRCRVLKPSCFVRYSGQLFYNETRLQEIQTPPGSIPPSAAPSPAPQPPQQPPPPSLPPPSLPPRSPPPISPPPSSLGSDQTVIIVISTVVPAIVIFLVIGGGFYWFCMRRKQDGGHAYVNPAAEPKARALESVHGIGEGELPQQYSFASIHDATMGFSEKKKLGEGRFGVVYLGRLANQHIAVKRLSQYSDQVEAEFMNEVELIARLQHRNLITFLGYSSDKNEKLLIYEFAENGSLDKILFDSRQSEQLRWETRYNIIMGIARGLLYLHQDSRLTIIHRDLKPSNILLDKNMDPKIADFGMARLFTINQAPTHTVNIAGTRGYMAPEYLSYGHYSVKSDVFSFGVLVLEIISWQRNDTTARAGRNVNLITSAWRNWEKGTISNVIDPVLQAGSGISRDMLRCIQVAFLCVQDNAYDRPTMNDVINMLNSHSQILPAPSEPTLRVPTIYETDYNPVFSHSSQDYNSRPGDLYPR